MRQNDCLIISGNKGFRKITKFVQTGLKHTMTTYHTQAVLCPNCRKLVSSDETRCPHCGISHPGARWKNNIWTAGFRNPDLLIRAIIGINIGMYVISLLLNIKAIHLSPDPFRIFSPSGESLLLLGMTGTLPIDQFHRWWSVVSANYLHGSILHILFNMMAFRQIAPFIVREYGAYRMIILYALCGVIGFWISYMAGTRLIVGASATICGLIGAAIWYGKSRGGTYGHAVYRQMGGWVMGIFILGLLLPNIDNWGHGGGLLAGIFLGFLLGYQEKRPENFFHKIFAGICLVLTVLTLIGAVASAIYYRISGIAG